MDLNYDRLEIDGIPTFAAHASPRYTGVLMFRTGRADESLRTSGITHLVEHLALHPFGPTQSFEMNGMVRGLDTLFWAQGRPEEVAGFLQRLAAGLRELPLARLKDEARVLRTEAAGRSVGPASEFMWMRFGATGHGLGALPEFGLTAVSPEVVQAWAAERFTAGNAALWFTGPPPKGLRLDLPPGPRIPPPPLTPIPAVRYPAWAQGSAGLIGASFVPPRRSWLSIPLQIAGLRLSQHLRYERGLTYDMALTYEPVTSDTSHAALWTTSLPEHVPAARDAVLSVLETMAREGATDEELAHVRDQGERAAEDPGAAEADVMAAALNELLGFQHRTRAELQAELESLDGPEIARRVAGALESALLLVPPPCEVSRPSFQRYPGWSEVVVRGRTFRPAKSAFPWAKGPRLVVGDDGVTWLSPEQLPVTVMYETCAVAAVHPGGALEVFGEDGFRVVANPPDWRGGHDAVREMLDRIPGDRVIQLPSDAAA